MEIGDAIAIVAIMLGVIGATAYAARKLQRRGIALGKADAVVLHAPGTYTEAFQLALDILTMLGASIFDADPNHGYILAGTGISLTSFGSTISLKFETRNLETRVTLEVRPTVGFLDWGISKRLARDFSDAWRVRCISQT